MSMNNYIDSINLQREINGFLSIDETLALTKNGNIIIDPFSTLIGRNCEIGANNKFYPCTIFEVSNDGSISIGRDNVFYHNCYFVADKGKIVIGDNNQFGDGGFSAKANMIGSEIVVSNGGRYLNGVQLLGKTYLGSGSQIIGNITVQNCSLAAGENYTYPNPDERGGLLKGIGLARNLAIEKGMVINGNGDFEPTQMKNQSYYHAPKK